MTMPAPEEGGIQTMTTCQGTPTDPQTATRKKGEIEKENTKTTDVLRISHVAGKGRVLVASRDIPPMTTIIQDTSIVSAPDGLPVCLVCLSLLSPAALSEEGHPCSGCGWPLCSRQCCEASNKLSSENDLPGSDLTEEAVVPAESDHSGECRLLWRSGFSPPAGTLRAGQPHLLYSVVAVIRMLLLKERRPNDWELVEELMDHWDQRRQDTQVVAVVRYMAALVRKKLSMSWVTDRDVEHVFGVLKTNGIGRGGRTACHLYPTVSLLSHACASNAELVGTPHTQVTFRAKRHIKNGEEITWSYTNVLESRPAVRETLAKTWLFECTCTRCLDPTESGLYYSSEKCLACGEGYLCIGPVHFTSDSAKLNQISCSANGQLEAFGCFSCLQVQQRDRAHEAQLHQMIKKCANAAELLLLMRIVVSEPGYHDHHYIATRLTMRLLDMLHNSEDLELLCMLLEKGKHLLYTLQVLEGEHSRPFVRYSTILSQVETKLSTWQR